MFKTIAGSAEPTLVREAAHDRRRSAIPFEVRRIPRVDLRHRDDARLQEEVRQEFSGLRKQLEDVGHAPE
jgi:hypothetical protein